MTAAPSPARPSHVQPSHVRFSAFGTYLFLAVRRPCALWPVVRLARKIVEDVDATCSRFRPDSDLSRANRASGTWVGVDPLLVAAVEVAREAATLTDGIVDPLLGRTLVRLGYDRDFRDLRAVPPDRRFPNDEVAFPGEDEGPGAAPSSSWRHIDLDPEGAIRVPTGTSLDLGSTAKAWTADLIAAAIETEVGEPALVSLGGDVRIAVPDERTWPIEVAERPQGPTEELVHLTSGGLATSSTRVRRWSHHGVIRHHVLDPRTGRPAVEVWRTVTATGPSCVAANTATTAAVVLGALAPPWLAERGVAARLVAADGDVVTTAGWPAAAAHRPTWGETS